MYRNVLLWLHIVGVAAWLGCNLALFVLSPWFARRGAAVAAAFAEATTYLATRYYNAAGGVVGVTGVLLVVHTGYAWHSAFVIAGLAALVVGAALGVVVFAPSGRALATAHRDGDVEGARRLTARTASFLLVDTTVVMVTALAMVARWRAR
ncbi:MAG: hypothetical protein M9961_02935 [Ilumatobacteraceae bacterium]|nr:hypothetical protein [Ilumatobacteraceae bacterium]